jgi:hypothetical protein
MTCLINAERMRSAADVDQFLDSDRWSMEHLSNNHLVFFHFSIFLLRFCLVVDRKNKSCVQNISAQSIMIPTSRIAEYIISSMFLRSTNSSKTSSSESNSLVIDPFQRWSYPASLSAQDSHVIAKQSDPFIIV